MTVPVRGNFQEWSLIFYLFAEYMSDILYIVFWQSIYLPMLFKASYCCCLMVATRYKVTISKAMSFRCQVPHDWLWGGSPPYDFQLHPPSGSTDPLWCRLSRSHTVRVTYVGVQAGDSGLGSRSSIDPYGWWILRNFRNQGQSAEAPQMYSEPLSNSLS